MFLSFYGLREQPFGVTPNPRYLYESAVHREALASLVYGIESGLGFTALIAAPGMGKTTLLYHVLEQYEHAASSAFIFDTQCDSRDLLQSLLSELNLDPNGQDIDLRNRFKQHLVSQAQNGRRVLVLIDEAQNLEPRVLESVRLLSNFETPREKLVHIVLSGQPQLEAKLATPEMLQLRQRIALFTRLAPFSPEETAEYIAHRLNVAGYRGIPLFTPNAMAMIAAETGGIPREINRMCFHALSLGYALTRHTIDAEILYEVVNDLRVGQVLPKIRWEQAADEPKATCESRPKAAPVEELQAPPEPKPGVESRPFRPTQATTPAAQAAPPAVRTQVERGLPKTAPPKPFVRPFANAGAQTQPDPFAARPRPSAPGPAQKEHSSAPAQRVPVAEEPGSEPPAPDPMKQASDAPEPGNSPLPPASAPPPPPDKHETPEPGAPDATVFQNALLDATLKSHRKTSAGQSIYVQMTGFALALPLLLWLVAYLLFRFDLVRLISH